MNAGDKLVLSVILLAMPAMLGLFFCGVCAMFRETRQRARQWRKRRAEKRLRVWFAAVYERRAMRIGQ